MSDQTELTTSSPIPLAEHGTEPWHIARTKGIGASEAAAACGLSEYETPLELWARKVGRLPRKETSDAMIRGTRFEPVLLKYAEDEVGMPLKPGPQVMYRHAIHQWFLATPDGEFDDGGETILECKSSVSKRVVDLVREGNPPPEYYLQCQQQLAVTGARVCVLLIATPDPWKFFDLTTLQIERDDETIKSLIDIESTLWDCIVTNTPPEPDFSHSSTCDLMKRIYAPTSDTSDIVSLNDDAIANWQHYEQLGEQIKELERRQDECKARVLHAIGEHFAGAIGDGRMVRRKLMPETVVKSFTKKSFVDVRAAKLPKGWK